MRKAKRKTHFEQIPLEAIEKLALEEAPAKKTTGRIRKVVGRPATKSQPYSVRILIDATRR